jgi:small subunit ribosomal protein S5
MEMFKEFEKRKLYIHNRKEQIKLLEKKGQFQDSELDFGGEFCIMVLETKMVSNVVSLGRVFGFTSLVYVGNFNGVVSYGRGRGIDSETSLQKAIANAKENLIGIDLDLYNTNPNYMRESFNNVHIHLYPRKETNSWGSFTFLTMLYMAGMNNFMFRLVQDSSKPLNLVYCFFKLLTRNSTPKLLAELNGQKIYTSMARTPDETRRYPCLFHT